MYFQNFSAIFQNVRGYGLVVEHVLAKDEMGVRFSLAAPNLMLVTLAVPSKVSRITETLKNNGFLAYLVGGCVRDLLMNRTPKDWDITTNARPEQIIALFPKTFYEIALAQSVLLMRKNHLIHH